MIYVVWMVLVIFVVIKLPQKTFGKMEFIYRIANKVFKRRCIKNLFRFFKESFI